MDLEGKLNSFREEFNQVCRHFQRNPSSVKILYATKYLNSRQFELFIDIMRQDDHDQILIGENRVQDWERKISFLRKMRPDLADCIYPVMIGNLQKNKINKAVTLFNEIHSIDNLNLAEALNARLQKANKTIPVYLEVNISGEETKHGYSSDEIESVIRELKSLKSLKLNGLMTMAPYTDNLEEIRGIYRKLRELAVKYGLQTSMGMSHDWKIAVQEGTDMIRIGSAVFV